MSRRLISLHSWLGLIGGIFLIVIASAGVILVFSDDIDDALHPPIACAPTIGERPTLNRIVADVKARYPKSTLSGIRMIPEKTGMAYTVTMNMAGALWFVQVDPYTGRILEARNVEGSFVRQVLALHRSFFFRPWGEAFVGLFAVVLFLASVTGAIIYRKSLLRVFARRIRWGRSGGVVAGDLHRLVGTVAIAFNLMMSITGFYLVSPAYAKLMGTEKAKVASAPEPRFSLDSLLEVSKGMIDGFEPRALFLAAPGRPIRVVGSVPDASILYGKTSSSVSFDAATGAVKEVVDIREAGWSLKSDQFLRALHFAHNRSLPVKLLYALGGLLPGTLSITGAIMWLRKRNKRSGRRRWILRKPSPARDETPAAAVELE